MRSLMRFVRFAAMTAFVLAADSGNALAEPITFTFMVTARAYINTPWASPPTPADYPDTRVTITAKGDTSYATNVFANRNTLFDSVSIAIEGGRTVVPTSALAFNLDPKTGYLEVISNSIQTYPVLAGTFSGLIGYDLKSGINASTGTVLYAGMDPGTFGFIPLQYNPTWGGAAMGPETMYLYAPLTLGTTATFSARIGIQSTPEPSSLALACVAVAIAGAQLVRRRRD